MLIHVVADYGHGDLAFAEVCQRLVLHLPDATLLTTPVPAFDTVSAGFCSPGSSAERRHLPRGVPSPGGGGGASAPVRRLHRRLREPQDVLVLGAGREGERLEVTIGGQSALATVTDGTFEVPVGELAFAPGSSGWVTRTGDRRRFFELFLRGGSAANRFGMPRAGAMVDLRAPAGSG
jgi:hypothetical protein